uniref:Transmembrane protein n=2 Tax=Lotharella globosa TaxID=91324 RepID=A0A7S3YY07_9EUKA|mmetsp:Transcript_9755/g.19180  ORF Transcript_9755/g.19180 Transcript_9755/m.19180 type:complete len:345 (+) Transcript_9755:522-1556(+)
MTRPSPYSFISEPAPLLSFPREFFLALREPTPSPFSLPWHLREHPPPQCIIVRPPSLEHDSYEKKENRPGSSSGMATMSDSQQEPTPSVVASGGLREEDEDWFRRWERIRGVFLWFTTAVAITHASVTACINLASAILGKQLGGVSSGVLFFVYGLTAFGGSTWLTYTAGLKLSIFLSLLLLCLYVAAFLVAAYVPALAWTAVIIGGIMGGFAAGWLWTAQGLYLSRMSKYTVLSGAGRRKAEGKNDEDGDLWNDVEANSMLSGIFGGVYVGTEVLTRIMSSIFFLYVGVGAAFAIFTALAIAAAFSTLYLPVPPEIKDDPSGDIDGLSAHNPRMTTRFSASFP